MPRILVVEDNAALAYGLQTTLELEGYEVAVAPDGPSGLQRAADWRPDLVVLDVMLPEIDGFHVLRALRQRGFAEPVLLLTAKGEEADKVLGFKLGADDYVTKPFGRMELAARVEALLRRTARPTVAGSFHGPNAASAPEDRPVERYGDVVIDPEARTVSRRGTEVSLAPKEFDLLLALVRRRGRAASRLDLLEEVWGYSAAVMTRTVDTHILELRRKLEDDPAEPRHLVTVRKVGYRLAP
jgi:DNA-binding response OmpR family regulator